MEAKIAILIDAENVAPAFADLIFAHAEALGQVVAREIFGTSTALTAWVAPVLKYAMRPNLTIKASKAKNSSDISLVIGAMDLLSAGVIDTVIIASSDSDFSALSVRLRNAGINVVGMGTEKSNPLWRTACSSFTVLELPKAQPARTPAADRPEQPRRQSRRATAKAAPAREEAALRAENPPARDAREEKPAEPVPDNTPKNTHETRAEVIRRFIARQIEAKGGRVQVSTLFPALNKLPEYRADRQDIGKKPLNYLTSTFSDVFAFELTTDGNSWVSLGGGAPTETPMPAEAEAEIAEAVEAPEVIGEADAIGEPEVIEEPEIAEVDKIVEEPEIAEVDEVDEEPEITEVDEVVEEPEIAEVDEVVEEPETAGEPDPVAEAPVERSDAEPGIARVLMDDGVVEDIARRIEDIFAHAGNLRGAYNELRTAFGNAEGREYYNRVKHLAGK